MVGAYLAHQKTGFTNDIVIGLVIYTFIMGGIYVLNQIMDIETDRINKKLFILADGYLPVKHAYFELAVLWLLAFIISLRFGLIFLFFIIISLLLGVLYSLPPIKIKGKPILDTLSNGFGYGMINFGVGWLIFRNFEWSMFLKFLPYFLSISAVFINTTIVDIKGDKEAKEITTAVFLGKNLSYVISSILMLAAIIISFILKDLICLIPALVSLPLFIYVAFYALLKNKIQRNLTIASFRLPGLIFTIITGFLYPPYLLVLAVLLIGMRIYYRKRFGISYPTLAAG